MAGAEREAWLDQLAEEDLEDVAPLTAEELAEIREFAGPWAGCRAGGGPGEPGSARVFPGESGSPAAFGSGMALGVVCARAGAAGGAGGAGPGGEWVCPGVRGGLGAGPLLW